MNTSSDEIKNQLGINESVLIEVRVQGAAEFGEQDVLRLEVEGSTDPLIVKPSAETIFGRRDPATGAMPDVDLTPFAGYRMGVSRRHAAIRFGDGQSLNVWDLGSSNGTYLNGERLNAHRPYRVHDGDELKLGQMAIRIRFQPAASGQVAVQPAKPDVSATANGPETLDEPLNAPPITSEFGAADRFAVPKQPGEEMPTTNPVHEDLSPVNGVNPPQPDDKKP